MGLILISALVINLLLTKITYWIYLFFYMKQLDVSHDQKPFHIFYCISRFSSLTWNIFYRKTPHQLFPWWGKKRWGGIIPVGRALNKKGGTRQYLLNLKLRVIFFCAECKIYFRPVSIVNISIINHFKVKHCVSIWHNIF